MHDELKQVGLTEIEAKVYTTLIELGPSLAGVLSRKSGIHRRMVYDSIDRLMEKGLVGYIVENNRKYFKAVNPERLKELLREKEESLNSVLPQLKLKYGLAKQKHETLFFRGIAGLKTCFEDQISAGKEILIIGASKTAYDLLKQYLKWFDARRKQRKIPVRILAGEKLDRKIPLARIKYLPKEFSGPAATNIYADKVAIIFWSRENPFAIVIKQKEIADSYRNYFEMLWKNVGK